MSRLVVLDTETTGLDPAQGHRIIEIGCVELTERRRTDTWHRYVNPGRAIEAGAAEVHGLTNDMLANEPDFASLADEFLDFVDGAELIIHNAAFDVAFLDAELGRLDKRCRALGELCTVTDSLAMARRLYPGQRNSLDALCKRLGIDNSSRQLHGALLDAQLLAEVYLGMTSGQGKLDFVVEQKSQRSPLVSPTGDGETVVLAANEQELAAHQAWLDDLDTACPDGSVWRRAGPTEPA